jgi:hypothetical protein
MLVSPEQKSIPHPITRYAPRFLPANNKKIIDSHQ